MENAITNLGMDPKQFDMQMLIHEADKRGNNQIDFDEFCFFMKTLSEKNRSWNEVIRDCFNVFDRVSLFLPLSITSLIAQERNGSHNEAGL